MKIKVLKFGGASFKDGKSILLIAVLIKNEYSSKVVVCSALYGVTDKLQEFIRLYPSLSSDNRQKNICHLINYLKQRHQSVLEEINVGGISHSAIYQSLRNNLDRLERLLYGVVYTEDLNKKIVDLILSFGERLAIRVCEAALNANGISCQSFDADTLGIITDGDFGNASADLAATGKNLRRKLLPRLKRSITPVITGFFGRDEQGHCTVMGRGGSDYSAAVIAHSLNADEMILWKDVDGFMTADPRIVPQARRIGFLSYDEAAELAYFGAKILHPRTIEPLKLKGIPLVIRNIYYPDNGMTIVGKRNTSNQIIKGVAYDRNIAALKIQGSGVGYKAGVLKEIVAYVSNCGINIKSVITSQTCITLLLSRDDLGDAYKSLRRAQIKTVEFVEPVNDIALIGIVSENLIDRKGLAGRTFSAAARAGINIEMISAGASAAAYYFIVKEKYLTKTVQIIHKEFFRICRSRQRDNKAERE